MWKDQAPFFRRKVPRKKWEGDQIYLKREDRKHRGSHKINHSLGEARDAFFELSRVEGIILALENAYAIKLAAKLSPSETILLNLSGRGYRDINFVVDKYSKEDGIA